MRKLLVVAALMLGVVAGLAPAVAAHSAGAPYCGIRWGSLTKESVAPETTAPIINVRAGRHGCFDRLVVDLGAPTPGFAGGQTIAYHVEYVPQVVEEGSGNPVPLAGGAFLEVFAYANAFDVTTGQPTYAPADRSNVVNVAGFRTFRQVAFSGSFEGRTLIGLGVRARLPFRVFVLSGPGAGSRLVIDVAHRW